MFQVMVPKRYNIEKLFYSKYGKDFIKTNSGKYYYKNLPEITDEILQEIKTEFKRPTFYLYLSEKGGEEVDYTKNYVQIICDTEGGKILPIKKIRDGYRANKEHAFFLGNELCTVEIYVENGVYMYKITKHVIDKYTGIYMQEEIYKAKLRNRISMPRKLKIFNDAIDAGCKKIKDYQCIKIYYSL